MVSYIHIGLVLLSSVLPGRGPFCVRSLNVTTGPRRMECPTGDDLYPCSCQKRRSGIYLSCSQATEHRIGEIISYLKQARHGDLQTINRLYIGLSTLPRLPSHFFMGLAINHLTISYSNLSSIQPSAMSALGSTLYSLDISSNELTMIPAFREQRLRVLRNLKLSHNKIHTIPDKIFEGLDSLIQLSLYGNRISAVSDAAFFGLSRTLTRLNLGGNHLTKFPTEAFHTLNHLVDLDLHDNLINHIEEKDFPQAISNLDHLNLRNNSIGNVEAEAFFHLRHLTNLDISENNIKHFDRKAFDGLDNLEYLCIGDNPLNAVPSESLRRLTNLQQLDLRNSNISVLTEDSFKGFCTNIKWLHLQYNHIKAFSELILDGCDSIQTLQLYGNWLTGLNLSSVSPVMDTLVVLDIHANPLICDCDLLWYRNWLADFHQQGETAFLVRNASCHVPSKNVDRMVLDVHPADFNCKQSSPYTSTASVQMFSPLHLLFCVAIAHLLLR